MNLPSFLNAAAWFFSAFFIYSFIVACYLNTKHGYGVAKVNAWCTLTGILSALWLIFA